MHGLAGAVLYGAIAGLLVAGLRWTLNRGGAGQREGERVLYRPRPGIRVIGVVIVLIGLIIWGYAILSAVNRAWSDAFWILVFGSFFVLLGLQVLWQQLVVDAEGLHYYRGLLSAVHIPWAQLSHYEVSGSAVVSVYLLRSLDPKKTIGITNLLFHVRDLLATVRKHVTLSQRPYHRRHWYGG